MSIIMLDRHAAKHRSTFNAVLNIYKQAVTLHCSQSNTCTAHTCPVSHLDCSL